MTEWVLGSGPVKVIPVKPVEVERLKLLEATANYVYKQPETQKQIQDDMLRMLMDPVYTTHNYT